MLCYAVCFHMVWIISKPQKLLQKKTGTNLIQSSNQLDIFLFMWILKYAAWFNVGWSLQCDCLCLRVQVQFCTLSWLAPHQLLLVEWLFVQFLEYTRNKFKSCFAPGNVHGWRQNTDSNCTHCFLFGTSVCTIIKVLKRTKSNNVKPIKSVVDGGWEP